MTSREKEKLQMERLASQTRRYFDIVFGEYANLGVTIDVIEDTDPNAEDRYCCRYKAYRGGSDVPLYAIFHYNVFINFIIKIKWQAYIGWVLDKLEMRRDVYLSRHEEALDILRQELGSEYIR